MNKLTFIIPLRAPESCNNWETVSKACTGTLQSIANQTSSNYQCVLVCHQPPSTLPVVENLKIIQVEYAPPKNYEERKNDKQQKIERACEYLKQHPSEFSMNLDADDRVHKELVSFVENCETSYGWRIGRGYVYPGERWMRQHKDTFDQLCGSSIITRVDDVNNPEKTVTVGHCQAKQHFLALGRPLNPIPFYAAVKCTGYGDNLTTTKFLKSESMKRTLKKLLMLRYASAPFKTAFAFDTHPVQPT